MQNSVSRIIENGGFLFKNWVNGLESTSSLRQVMVFIYGELLGKDNPQEENTISSLEETSSIMR